MAPLLLHLVFHPDSPPARAIASALHRAMNKDALLPGLAIPTRIVNEDGSSFPPTDYSLDEAEHSVAVVLADDKMACEETAPAGRSTWADFVAQLNQACKDGRHRFLPIQLSKSAWPLHEELRSINFIRAHDVDDANREAFIERQIVIEIARFLLGLDRGSQVPITLFLSHVKQDIGKGLKPLEAIQAHLQATQPVSTWIDSGQIQAGSNFEIAIENAIRNTAVLALVTEHYSSSSWCRREVLMTKRHCRPFVIVDALDGVDVRAFPYIGNAPMVAWANGGAQRAVDLILKEQLRHLHVRRLLNRASQPGDTVLPVPPELATVTSLPARSAVFYPDPPLGDEEMEGMTPLAHTIETPLQRASRDRTLAQRKIALSISESDCPERAGVFRDHLDAALLEISRYLLVKGATLTYGGNLGSTGYTIKLFNLVLAHQNTSGVSPVERIVNYVGWPLPLTDNDRATYRWQATLRRTDMPPGMAMLEPATFVQEPKYFPADSPARRFAWSRGMTLMRERQTAEMTARIALGGKVGPTRTTQPDHTEKVAWYSGRIPGVLEEIILTLRAGKPLYLCGGFGGAAAVAIELLEGRVPQEFTWNYQKQAPHSEALRDLYGQHGVAWEDYPELAKICADIGVDGLSRTNHLTPEQNRELFRSHDVPRIIELLLTGLART